MTCRFETVNGKPMIEVDVYDMFNAAKLEKIITKLQGCHKKLVEKEAAMAKKKGGKKKC